MGSWGYAIFSDDLAADIRADYRELLEDGVADLDATSQILNSYGSLASDEAHILWLALAASQCAVGRLDEAVKAKALEVIDHGVGPRTMGRCWSGGVGQTPGCIEQAP